MKNIITKALYELEKEKDIMLVTIVGSEGSAPRSSGSMMLVGTNGRILGSIGGGSIEYNSEKRAVALLAEKSSGISTFELTAEAKDNIGMVCGGNADVLFKFISHEDKEALEVLKMTAQALSLHENAWLIQSLQGNSIALLNESHHIAAATAPEETELFCAPGFINRNGYFSMPLPRGERALIFGGGHIAQALVPILSSVDFRPVVMDNREEYSDPALFKGAEKVMKIDYLDIDSYIEITPEDYIVVMTNGHSHDYEVQLQVLKKNFAYIGVVGSAKKTAAVNEKLHACGITEEKTAAVHTPIGTKIKAATPEEIAISIAGEMILERALRRESQGIGKEAGCPMHR